MRFLFTLLACLLINLGHTQSLQEDSIQNTLPNTSMPGMEAESKTVNSKAKTYQKASKGELIVDQDDRIDLLIQDYTENKKTIGYRVQLFSGNSRWEAVKVKSDFLKKYKEETPPHLVYQSPNFKIRVGDYRDRLEAQKFLEIYKAEYPSAFIVKDEIEISLND